MDFLIVISISIKMFVVLDPSDNVMEFVGWFKNTITGKDTTKDFKIFDYKMFIKKVNEVYSISEYIHMYFNVAEYMGDVCELNNNMCVFVKIDGKYKPIERSEYSTYIYYETDYDLIVVQDGIDETEY